MATLTVSTFRNPIFVKTSYLYLISFFNTMSFTKFVQKNNCKTLTQIYIDYRWRTPLWSTKVLSVLIGIYSFWVSKSFIFWFYGRFKIIHSNTKSKTYDVYLCVPFGLSVDRWIFLFWTVASVTDKTWASVFGKRHLWYRRCL